MIIILPGEYEGTTSARRCGPNCRGGIPSPTFSGQGWVRSLRAVRGAQEAVSPLREVHQKPAAESKRKITHIKRWPMKYCTLN